MYIGGAYFLLNHGLVRKTFYLAALKNRKIRYIYVCKNYIIIIIIVFNLSSLMELTKTKIVSLCAYQDQYMHCTLEEYREFTIIPV